MVETLRCIAHKVPMSKRCSEGRLCLIIKLQEEKVKEMAGPKDKAGRRFFFVALVRQTQHKGKSILESTRDPIVPMSKLKSVLLYW